MKEWATAVAWGVPDELYWQLDDEELKALTEEIMDRERALQRADNLRAGLITAMVYNRHRTKKEKAKAPEDFFREPREVPPEGTLGYLKEWAEAHNARIRKKRMN